MKKCVTAKYIMGYVMGDREILIKISCYNKGLTTKQGVK